jgi:hypothetical protein
MEGILCLLGYMVCGFFFTALFKLALEKGWLDKANDSGDDFGAAVGIFLFWPLVMLILAVVAVAVLFLLPVFLLFSEDES